MARQPAKQPDALDLFGVGWEEVEAPGETPEPPAAPRPAAREAQEIPQPGKEPPTPQPGREPPTPQPGREPPTPQPGREPRTPQPGREPPTPQPGREPPTPLPGQPRGPISSQPARPEPEREVWTVSQVNRAVKNLLEGTLPQVWVSGEVAGWQRARSGHCYFTLKDDRAQIRCVMFRMEAERLPIDPEDGMEIRVLGSLTLYEGRGEYQLVVRVVEVGGADGLWKLAFERLRKKLDAEGLLAPERKRPLPRCPATVGVVTSTSGAALKDILTTIRKRAPWTRVVVRNARVQGEGASLEVAEAVRALARSGLVDVLIVGRGGGSIEDLWAFNEEPVARAVAASPVPVISAVGHEVDVTISDLVADARAATPSAAAELAVLGSAQVLDGLRRLPPRLSRALRSAASRRRRTLSDSRAGLTRALRALIARRTVKAERGGERLEKVMRRTLERRRQRLAASAGKLDALSPLATLQRGYSVALGPGGKVLRRVADFQEGSRFVLRVQDGRVDCEAGAGRADDAAAGLE